MYETVHGVCDTVDADAVRELDDYSPVVVGVRDSQGWSTRLLRGHESNTGVVTVTDLSVAVFHRERERVPAATVEHFRPVEALARETPLGVVVQLENPFRFMGRDQASARVQDSLSRDAAR